MREKLACEKLACEKLAKENPLELLRLLKGCPLAVVFALALARRPAGQTWIAQATGYSENTVQQALEYLAEIGLAVRSGRYEGWSLAAEQLSLFFSMVDSRGNANASANVPASAENEPQNSSSEPQNLTFPGAAMPEDGGEEGDEPQNLRHEPRNPSFEPHNLRLPGRITTTTYLTDRESRLKAAVVVERTAKTIVQSSKTDARTSKNDARVFAENLEALHAAGVRGKVAEQLARLEYVTPAYVRAHAAKVAQDGDKVGLLVTRIRDGDPSPLHAKNCLCVDCDRERRRKYAGGEYAEFIQH